MMMPYIEACRNLYFDPCNTYKLIRCLEVRVVKANINAAKARYGA
jgi:hypothetical protein